MRRRVGILTTVVVGSLVAAACASSDPYVRTRGAEPLSPDTTDQTNDPFDTVPDTVDEPTDDTDPTGSTLPDAGGPVFTMPADKQVQPYDADLEAMINDIENFWRNEYPAVYGSDYIELAAGVHPMRRGDSISPGCGEPRTDYVAVEGNAFYCPDGDFIAYDDEELFPQLVDSGLGNISLGVVLAHEWGHAIQSRAGYEDETVFLEQQADCFAGSWVAHVARGESDEITFTDQDLKNSLNAMISVRDPAGTTSQTDPGAHGSAFDRVGAFEDGFRNGASKCADYPNNKPTVIQFPYEFDANGNIQENAPLTTDEGGIINIVQQILDLYWPTVVTNMPTLTINVDQSDPAAACPSGPGSIFKMAVYCPDDNVIYASLSDLQGVYDNAEYGDMGVAYILATAGSEAVMQTTGASVEGEERVLAADCLVGAFSRSVLPKVFNPNRLDSDISLTPGDLDEAVSTAIAAADDEEDTDRRGTPFEKIEAFRLGVLGDYSSCQDRFGV